MSPGREIVAGVRLSLSGAFRLQGEQALNGLRLGVNYVTGEGGLPLSSAGSRVPLRLLALNDRSQVTLARENVLRLLTQDRVDFLIGPYSSGLTLAVAPVAEAHGKVLWTHGGASDAIFQQGWRHLVSVPSPSGDYFRARVKTLAVVGAGLEAFHTELGDLAEAVIGPSPWEPARHEDPLIGPSSEWFFSEFFRTFYQRPGYPAAQAFAVGVWSWSACGGRAAWRMNRSSGPPMPWRRQPCTDTSGWNH